jgi:hypothetical protein
VLYTEIVASAMSIDQSIKVIWKDRSMSRDVHPKRLHARILILFAKRAEP